MLPISLIFQTYKWWIIAAATAALALFFALWLRGVKAEAFKAGQDSIRTVYEAAASKALSDKQIAEAEIAQLAKKSREKAEANAQADRVRTAAVVASLRQRADRPVGDGRTGSAAPALCGTGAGLYRPDGEFLARFAASAAGIVRERDECRERYEGVRQELNKLRELR